MKNAITSTLLAAAVLGGGVVGTTALAGASGGSSGEPTLAEEVSTTDVAEVADDGGILNVQDAETDEAPEVDGESEDCERRGHRRGGRNLGTVAEVLGLEVDELRAQLSDGATIADVAGDDVDAVIDALIAEKTERIAEAVENGRLTQDEADEKLAELEDRVTDKVNGIRAERGDAADGEISS